MESLRKLYKITAGALAADRSTKFLPVLIAQGVYIGSVAIAFAKTSAAKPGPSNYVNIGAHSIAFSAIYFWIIPAVLLGSVIGVSQSELAIPRILELFKESIKRVSNESSPNTDLEADGLPANKELQATNHRSENGGIYSWRSGEWHISRFMHSRGVVQVTPDGRFKTWLCLLAVLVVFVGTFTGKWISARVPPEGLDCRHFGQGAILLTWVFSFLFNFLLKPCPPSRRFWIVFLKDVLATTLTVFGIIITQAGIFNRCSCWTKFGQVGLTLPQDPPTLAVLEHRIRREYLFIAFGSIIVQLAFFGGVWYRFRLAFRVFLQRDDDTSNRDLLSRNKPSNWWLIAWNWLRRIHRKIFTPTGPKKAGESSGDSTELMPLFPGGNIPAHQPNGPARPFTNIPRM